MVATKKIKLVYNFTDFPDVCHLMFFPVVWKISVIPLFSPNVLQCTCKTEESFLFPPVSRHF